VVTVNEAPPASAAAPDIREPIEVTLTAEESGERIDRVLAARALGHSRSTLQRWIGEGRVTLDGTVVRSSTVGRAGARVIVRPLPPPPSNAQPEDIPIDVVFEDEHLLVVNKAAGMVVHPSPGHAGGTLVNALRFRVGLMAGEAERPGIVHRIDRDTSGLLVIAKSNPSREGLIERFKTHDIEREYQTIVIGEAPAQLTYDTLHGRHPYDRKKFTGKVSEGKRAVTHVTRLRAMHGTTLLACRLETGRTHQIRIHLSEGGLPILADPIYGKRARDERVQRAEQAIGRLALHARVLGFVHPITGKTMHFESDLPADFQRALEVLS
jgi:23S rRNA pseudouridine1911/1915/1917 synthase